MTVVAEAIHNFPLSQRDRLHRPEVIDLVCQPGSEAPADPNPKVESVEGTRMTKQIVIDENTLRTILGAVMKCEYPTVTAVADATGICEDCVSTYFGIAEMLGLMERV